MAARVRARSGRKVRELKELLAQAARVLDHEGVCDFRGHISARIPGSEQALITPISGDRIMKWVTAEDIVSIDLEGNKLAGRWRPPGERALHTAILRARPEVMSVVHGHPTLGIAMSLCQQPFHPLHHQALPFAGGVPVFPSSLNIQSQEEGEALARTLGRCNAVLLKGHGVVVVGDSIEQAVANAIALEKNIQVQFVANILNGGRPVPGFPPEELARARIRPASAWDYYLGRLPQ